MMHSPRPLHSVIESLRSCYYRREACAARRKAASRLRSARRPHTLAAMKTDAPPVSHPGLIRALGPLMAVAVVVGTVIGSGVFKKPQIVAENIPYFGLAASVWIVGGLMALLGALSLAEVAVLYPRAGG